jgi:hypothetical protein
VSERFSKSFFRRAPHLKAGSFAAFKRSGESLTLLQPVPKLAVLFYEDFGL